MVHVPGVIVVTVVPETLHTAGVPEPNDTGRPDEAEADKVTGTPTVASGGWEKVIVCAFFPATTWNDLATSGAGA
jgi:hypothetical protein